MILPSNGPPNGPDGPPNDPDGPSNGPYSPYGPPNDPDGRAGDRQLWPDCQGIMSPPIFVSYNTVPTIFARRLCVYVKKNKVSKEMNEV